MPKTLTDDATQFPPVEVPIDGEPRTAGSVETPFAQLAHRTANVRDRLLFVDPSRSGVRRVRTVADIPSLKATPVTDYGDGQLARVRRFGLYEFEALASDPPDDRLVVRPNDIAANYPGRWVHEHAATLGTPNWMAQLDAGGQIPVEKVSTENLLALVANAGFLRDANAIIAAAVAKAASGLHYQTQLVRDAYAADSGWTFNGAVPQFQPDGNASNVPMSATSIVEVDWFGSIAASDTTDTLTAQLYAGDARGVFADVPFGAPVRLGASVLGASLCYLGGTFSPPSAGIAVRFRPQFKASGAVTTFTFSPFAYMRVRLVQP